MTKSSQTTRRPRFLTIKEVAELLNYSERAVRRWISSGALEAHRPGREWRIARQCPMRLTEAQRNQGKAAVQHAAKHNHDDPGDQCENLQQPGIRGRLVGI